MKYIVKTDFENGLGLTNCPFLSDLNTCNVQNNTPINYCPEPFEGEDGLYEYKLPDDCPLLKGSVIVKLSD